MAARSELTQTKKETKKGGLGQQITARSGRIV